MRTIGPIIATSIGTLILIGGAVAADRGLGFLAALIVGATFALCGMLAWIVAQLQTLIDQQRARPRPEDLSDVPRPKHVSDAF